MFRRTPFFALVLAALALGGPSRGKSEFEAIRPPETYAGTWLSPDQVLLEDKLWKLSEKPYVTVRGIGVYYSHPDDGDDHFSIISSERVIPGTAVPKSTLHQFGLTCEIKPAIRLKDRLLIKKFKRTEPATYRFVEVKGRLRFGTEGASGHDGVRTYVHRNKPVTGHWEIHPVEAVRSLDTGPAIACGPAATREDPMAGEMAIMGWDIWRSLTKQNNHARLKAKVLAIRPATASGGDIEVELEEVKTSGSKKKAIARVPPYFASYDGSSKTLNLMGDLLGGGGTTLKVGDKAYFFGLRSWTFPKTRVPAPVLWPVMRIDPL